MIEKHMIRLKELVEKYHSDVELFEMFDLYSILCIENNIPCTNLGLKKFMMGYNLQHEIEKEEI